MRSPIAQVILLPLNLRTELESTLCFLRKNIHTSIEVINVQLTLDNVRDDITAAIYKTARGILITCRMTCFSCP